ncbi:thyroid receptor-interacting protein 13 [Coprinopsis cinerea okayama7|uniref:Thyroid receptor-interacting protein 13 n=1 Tax=Coprinopsis cinerea (strain Okayama-7 / 130 / ATCC MYA-4618 / FGSC 9003) TaxID=240176 RepID=A8NWS0_COPC7|nr:thyroid receptor-interacting protein 13 [Coprinopsis cinerea okayama7\|eukprot:XP_001836970.1 thyroid receptor-interacting protein 13 [Coprinopsis cinerea okayama7\
MGSTIIENQEEGQQPAASGSTQWPVHVEVRLQPRTAAKFDTVRSNVRNYISSFDRIAIPSKLQGWQSVTELASTVEQITICESRCPSTSLNLSEANLQIHVYQPLDSGSFDEFSNSAGADDDDTMAASVCELPNRSWEGLWDSLVYSNDVKMKLLDYIHATLILSDVNVDFNLVSWNRVVLLHGPPGTGKTSLCRALAQKLAIRFSHRYSNARLLEINSHSLFSKWFSESGKLVQRLFTSITDLVDEEDAFVVVLIDEVESLTAARAGAMAGTEPSDGLRVVNALLTQLDKLKHRKNVLVMATSNLVKAIDNAFVDRADIIQYIDLPSREAVYDILRSSVSEIMSKGVIAPLPLPSLMQVQLYEVTAKPNQSLDYSSDANQRSRNAGLKLLHLAAKCQAHGMSGRSLRRLPVLALAHSLGLGRPTTTGATKVATAPFELGGTDVETWIAGMDKIVDEHGDELQRVI